MRRLTGTYDGKRYRLFEYDNGVVDRPPALRQDLLLADGLHLPTGEALDDACLVLFGESMHVEEFYAMPWVPSDAKKHKAGLSPQQARQWAAVANSALTRCQDAGESDCDGRAIRQANAAVRKALRVAYPAEEVFTVDLQADITKSDDDQRRVFGWASIAVRKDGEIVVDLQEDVIEIHELEEAWYAYVAESGELDFRHEGPVRGHLIEAMVFTPEKVAALGLAPNSMPLGAWVGYEIEEAEDYALVKRLGFFMFSIAGSAIREPL